MKRKIKRKFNICFIGGNRAGILGVLTLLSAGHKVLAAVSFFDELTNILKLLEIPVYLNSDDRNFIRFLSKSDILINVHGREILTIDKLNLPKKGCFNVHPYLYCYKGFDPIKRAVNEKNFKGSVGVHKMEIEIDKGPVLLEQFVDVSKAKTEIEVYNILYPYYSVAILKALTIIRRKY